MSYRHITSLRLHTICLLSAVAVVALLRPLGAETWTIVTSDLLKHDAAIDAAVEDLQVDGEKFGISFERASTAPDRLAQTVIVGNAARNRLTKRLVAEGTVR